MMRPIVLRIAIVSGSLVIALGIAEVAVRVFALAPGFAEVPYGQHRTCADPELVWELNPGAQGVNSLGLRGPEIEQSKTRRRLLVLGDSIAFGLNLDDADTVASRLQTMLDAKGAGVEVLNGGVPGYNPTQEVRWLETKADALDVDAVVLLFCVNDIAPLYGLPEGELRYAARGDAHRALNLVHNARNAGPTLRWLLRHSHLCRLLFDRKARIEQPDFQQGADLSHVRRGFERLRALGSARGIDVDVVLVPYFTSYAKYPYQWIHDEVGALARECGFDVVDLLPAAREYARGVGRPLGLPGDPLHPNADGAKWIAHELMQHWFR